MEEKIIHITSGRGPAECMWVVSKLLGEVMSDAKLKGIEAIVLQRVNGEFPYTLVSATLKIQGKSLNEFVLSWEGSILWIGQSTFRKFHKRKNWFVELQFVNVPKKSQINPLDIEFRTSRSSGPGGQHVNKTESAVRATHVSSGLSVFVQDSRSQHQNKKIALERLTEQYTNYQLGNCMDQDAKEWKEKISVQRGNPIKIFQGPKFQLKN